VPTWLTVVAVIAGVLLLLALGGAVANARRERATRKPFAESLEEVDGALAAALAADHGWEPTRLESAARSELAARRPGEEVRDLRLVQVIDRPGTNADEAVFEATLDGGPVRLSLARRGDEWFGARFDASA
jgi:cytochrome c-type biogenesis protein CcmH/NrfG